MAPIAAEINGKLPVCNPRARESRWIDALHEETRTGADPSSKAIQTAGASAEPAPQRYDLAKKASEIDPRAREHPEIGFVFQDAKGKVLELQHATVDTRVKSQGKLVIWLMDHNNGLFERISSYGLHGIQVHYANRWFTGLSKETLNDGKSLGNIRLEAATGEDHSPEQFLTPDGQGLLWDKVILSGISHGSTTAARFAIHQRVDRVVMFSGPRDNTENWQGLRSAPPPTDSSDLAMCSTAAGPPIITAAPGSCSDSSSSDRWWTWTKCRRPTQTAGA